MILTHLGRPKGKVVPDMSVAPVAAALSALLGCDVLVESDVTGPGGRAAVERLADGDVLMMENLRFHPGEEANDQDFAAALAALGEIYVGDAFSCTHRAHASVEALPRLMEVATAGRSLGEELTALHNALADPTRPVAAIVGGAKVSTKLQVLENLVTNVDTLILGGGMANTFLLARGQDVGASLVEATWWTPPVRSWPARSRLAVISCFPKISSWQASSPQTFRIAWPAPVMSAKVR